MNRWILVLLICVALYVGVVLVQGLVTAVEHPAPQPASTLASRSAPAAPPPLLSPGMSPSTPPATPPAVGATGARVSVSQMRDSRGNTVVAFGIAFSGGSSPTIDTEPTLTVRDAAGNVVHSGKFEFG